ncbi:MAG: PAS domain-containing protein [Bacillota bacterium]
MIDQEKTKEQLIEELAELRREREYLKAVLELPSGVVVAEAPSGKLIMGNHQVAEILGYPFIPSSSVEQYYEYKGFHRDGRPYLSEDWPLARSISKGEKVYKEETEFQRGDGSRGTIQLSSTPIIDQDGQIMAGVVCFTDITEQKRFEMELVKSEKKYRQLFNSMTEGLVLCEVICDENGVPIDYRYLEANPATELMTGLKRKKILGRTFTEFYPGTDSYWVETFGKVALTGEPIKFQRYSSEFIRYYDCNCFSPEKGKFALAFIDITEHKNADEQLHRNQADLEQQVAERTEELAGANRKMSEEIAVRLQTEIMLRESNLKMANILESIGDAFFSLDDQWRFTYVNKEAERLLGRSRDFLIGKNIFEELPIYKNTPYFECAQQVMSERILVEVQDQGIQNEQIWFSTRIYPGNDGGIAIYLRDVTENKSMVEGLRRSEEKFRTTMDNMIDCFGILNAVRDENGEIVDYLIDYMNGSACAHHKMSKEQQEGKLFWEVFPGYDRALFNEYCRVVETGESLILESLSFSNEYKRHLTGIYDLRAVKLGDGIAITWRNISEQKEVIESLRQSEERFFKAFRSSPLMMAIIRNQDDRYMEVNKKWEEVTGYSHEEAIGHSIAELKTFADQGYADELISKVKEDGELYNAEATIINRLGEPRTLLLNSVLTKLHGETCRLIVAQDITDKKRMEINMARLDRLNLLGQMAASISHEIRNPLTTVRGFLQVLREKDEYIKDKEYFNLMIEELDRANKIISEYLTLARDRVVDYRNHNLNDIINTLQPMLQANAIVTDKVVKLSLSDIPYLRVYDEEIRQMILNLAKNGLEAMSPGGVLEIRTYRENGEVVLAIKDHGPGVAPALIDKLGTPFLTTKGDGTGLGLAVCYRIAERHNASINVESDNHGASFYVRFKLPD